MRLKAEPPWRATGLRSGSMGSGKRATLEWLRPLLDTCSIPQGFAVAHARWSEARESTLDEIVGRMDGFRLAVRSDHEDEDSLRASNAGHYRTCLDVDGGDRRHIGESIDAVFASYGRPRHADEVFVQQQITPVRDAAVAFTHALPDAAPYYVLSVCPGPRSDNVTRGAVGAETWYLARDSVRLERLPAKWRGYLQCLLQIETTTAAAPCEVEMAADEAGRIWLLQARPLPLRATATHATAALRKDAERTLAALPEQPPLLGMMPDWNPAELLGEHPRPLARDLFDRLITRRAWQLGRAALGYAQVPDARLMRIYAGRPYIDVRASLHSLLPQGLPAPLAARLVEAGCRRLRDQPELHDKIEFEIAFTTALPRLGFRVDRRYPGLLDDAERLLFSHALRVPTANVLDEERAQRLADAFETHACVPLHADPHALARALEELELGTATRFATAARMAFAVEALLRTLLDHAGIDASQLWRLKRAILSDAADADAAPPDLGHVRAGTFEIAVPPRREVNARAFAEAMMPIAKKSDPADFAAGDWKRLDEALAEADVAVQGRAFVAHYRRLLLIRERGKFALARGVSAILDALQVHAARFGIGREDSGWLTLTQLLDRGAGAEVLQRQIEEARAQHAAEALLRMPLLIDDARLDVVRHGAGEANYLGSGVVSGRAVLIDAHTHPDEVPMHAIAAIASADPGFDWLFLRRPAALVTAFGGPNSHMAIRCAEAAVPALLGLGPENFKRMLTADRIAIDFDTRTWSTS